MQATNTTAWIGVFLAGVALAASASAGQRSSPRAVHIDDVIRNASGNLDGSIDTNDNYIGCDLYGDGAAGVCYAFGQVFEGVSISRGERFCWTTNAEHLAVIRAMHDDSFISFRWNAAADCTRVSATSGSHEAPRAAVPALSTSGISINPTIRFVAGTLGEIHNSTSTRARLDCTVSGVSSGITAGTCAFANDDTPEGFNYICRVESASMRDKIRAIKGSSYVSVRWEGEALRSNTETGPIAARCISMQVNTSSFNLAKQP